MLLRKGANPNALVSGRERMLAYAVKKASTPEIYRALIKAGADVREPFTMPPYGEQVRLSDAACGLNRPQEIINLLKDAENLAQSVHGPLPPLKKGRVCNLKQSSQVKRD